MKFFDLKKQCIKLNNPQIMNLTRSLEFYRGKTFNLPEKIKINRLHIASKRKSTTSSNEIEGIRVSHAKEKAILESKSAPQTYEEKMIFNYNKVLTKIFKIYQYQSLNESFILDLHYELYESYNPEFGGKYKVQQNYIREYDNKGKLVRTVFIPTKPEDVQQLMSNLIYQFNQCVNDPKINVVVLIYMFILDFLCIHPFFDGNGRISRLLTTFLLLKYGYEVDRYYAISYLILQNISQYYDCLELSSKGWDQSKNNYEPFVAYMLDLTVQAYKKVTYIFEINNAKLSAKDKVLKVINDAFNKITKADLEEILVNLSRTTIEKALHDLVKENKIQQIHKGHYACYYKK